MWADRREAGRELGREVLRAGVVRPAPTPWVLGIARGGVVVGAEVARALGARLYPLVIRKVGAPGNPELGLGAVGPGGRVVWNEELLQRLGMRPENVQEEVRRQVRLQQVREERYGASSPPPWAGADVVVVDDGLATGYTAVAARDYLESQPVGRRILAVPVGPPVLPEEVVRGWDAIVLLRQPQDFDAIGRYYRSFLPVSDEEVLACLAEQDGAGKI